MAVHHRPPHHPRAQRPQLRGPVRPRRRRPPPDAGRRGPRVPPPPPRPRLRGLARLIERGEQRPPGASQRSASARARAGSRWKSPTRTARIASKRRSPRSASSSAATRNSAAPDCTNAALRRAAAAIIAGERSIAVSRAPRSHRYVAATPWPQPISSTRSPSRTRAGRRSARSRSLTPAPAAARRPRASTSARRSCSRASLSATDDASRMSSRKRCDGPFAPASPLSSRTRASSVISSTTPATFASPPPRRRVVGAAVQREARVALQVDAPCAPSTSSRSTARRR